MWFHPVLGVTAAFGSVPALGEHPGGAGGRAGVRMPPVRRAGRESGEAAEARRGAGQQTSTEK